MSTYNPHHKHVDQTYEAVRSWVQRSLLGTKSTLSSEPEIWTAEKLDELDTHFVQNLDAGEGDFLSKLEGQIAGASPDAIKLMAEINWLLLLFASRISPATKRHTVERIWSWAGDPRDLDTQLLSDDVLQGIGHAGVAFNLYRWKEVAALVSVLRVWKALDDTKRRDLLDDPWRFLAWLDEQEEIQTRAVFQILPHLVFPESFERISSKKDKIAILVGFTDSPKKAWNRKSQAEIDRALLDLRQQLEEREGKKIDFYWDDMKPIWQPGSHRAEIVDDDQLNPSFAAVLSDFLDAYGKARTGPFTTVGAVSRTKAALHRWLADSEPISSRDTLKVKISVGQGNWTRTPWIALLDERVTTSTQRGFYVVFLISDDLSVTYLTLNQGMTELVARLGQRGATQEMESFAHTARVTLSDELGERFELSNEIDLQAQTSASTNYEVGTIAHKAYETGALPDDDEVIEDLEQILEGYDALIEAQQEDPPTPVAETQLYGVDDALKDLFLDRAEVEELLETWESKTNLILQGAPGVGKSFVSRRLAYCLMGEEAPERICPVQFHQSYSYEDFVRGFRPSRDGGFSLQDGIFYEFCRKAADDPQNRYVLLIDEINRGNLSKILGELMLLIEADKREAADNDQKQWTVRLAYSNPDEEAFWVPKNLFVLGMMNTADRSLSLVDYALRRRFAFAEMSPKFSSAGLRLKMVEMGVPEGVAAQVIAGMEELNAEISADKVNLGPGFAIGHSFFVPRVKVTEPAVWHERIVRTEIYPLLKEYWFDEPEKAESWRERLLAK